MLAKYPAAMYGPDGVTRVVKDAHERQVWREQGWTDAPPGVPVVPDPPVSPPAHPYPADGVAVDADSPPDPTAHPYPAANEPPKPSKKTRK